MDKDNIFFNRVITAVDCIAYNAPAAALRLSAMQAGKPPALPG